MSYNRGSSRRGGRGGTTNSSSTYRRRRNSGWNRGSDSSGRRANRESRYTGSDSRDENPDSSSGITDHGTGIYNRGSDSDREPEERRYSSRDTADTRRSRRKRSSGGSGLPSINWKIVAAVLIVIGVIVAIIYSVNSIQTDGMLFSKLGEDLKQFCIKLLWLLVGSIIEWAIVAFTIFKGSGAKLKAVVFVGIFVLVIVASFKNIVAITILILLLVASVLKFIFFRK